MLNLLSGTPLFDAVKTNNKLALETILKQVLHLLFFQPGITTDDIDSFVHEQCITHNCYPSPLMYKGFPKSVCTSVNNVLIHGIPDDRPLEDGDIVNVDITVSIYRCLKYLLTTQS